MPASLLLYERHVLSSNSFAELRIWQVPTAVRGSVHGFKYSLALIVSGECVLRFDNEAGKGNHRHLGETELSYEFVDPTKLLRDFWAEVDRWQRNEK